MDLLSPPSITPPQVVSFSDGAMSSQSDFSALRHQVADELSDVQKYAQRIHNDQCSLRKQANLLARELKTAMSTVFDQQRHLGMNVGPSTFQLHHWPQEHRSLSGGLQRSDASHREAKQGNALRQAEAHQACDAQRQQSSQLKHDFDYAQAKNDAAHQQIIQQMRVDTNQADRS